MAQIRIWIIFEGHFIKIFEYSNIRTHQCFGTSYLAKESVVFLKRSTIEALKTEPTHITNKCLWSFWKLYVCRCFVLLFSGVYISLLQNMTYLQGRLYSSTIVVYEYLELISANVWGSCHFARVLINFHLEFEKKFLRLNSFRLAHIPPTYEALSGWGWEK